MKWDRAEWNDSSPESAVMSLMFLGGGGAKGGKRISELIGVGFGREGAIV